MISTSPWMYTHRHAHSHNYTHTQQECASRVILLFLPLAFFFCLLLPYSASPPSFFLRRSLNLSFCLSSLWRSCNWFSSVYSFFKTGFETWEADKSHSGPSSPAHSIPLLSSSLPPYFPLRWPSSIQNPSERECGGMRPPSRTTSILTIPTTALRPSFLQPLSVFIPSTFVPSPPLRPCFPFSHISDHIPLTELKSCITLKTLPMHPG